jgi:hypothetical protein
MRPEDRGCLQRLVHLEPLIDARQPLFGRPRPVMATPRKTMPRARQTWQSCSSATSSADRRFVKKPELARPYVEETHVEEREGVVQASCQLQPTFGPQGATGEAATGLPVARSPLVLVASGVPGWLARSLGPSLVLIGPLSIPQRIEVVTTEC